jgi:hypothetical protein
MLRNHCYGIVTVLAFIAVRHDNRSRGAVRGEEEERRRRGGGEEEERKPTGPGSDATERSPTPPE